MISSPSLRPGGRLQQLGLWSMKADQRALKLFLSLMIVVGVKFLHFIFKDLFVKQNVYGLMDFPLIFIYNKLLIELLSKDILYIYIYIYRRINIYIDAFMHCVG